MTPTERMLEYVRKCLTHFRGWKESYLPDSRRHYRRYERVETYLIARLARRIDWTRSVLRVPTPDPELTPTRSGAARPNPEVTP